MWLIYITRDFNIYIYIKGFLNLVKNIFIRGRIACFISLYENFELKKSAMNFFYKF